MKTQRIIIHDNVTDLNQALVSRWADIARQAIKKRGSFHVALAGGSTPKQLYYCLADAVLSLPWQQTHIYFGDERCVDAEHEDSNYRMAFDAMLNGIGIPKENIHRIIGENPDPTLSATNYHQTLEKNLPHDKDGYHFDLILLGLGPDGHIASLFPSSSILTVRDKLCAAVYIDKFSSWRISITYPLIEKAKHVLILVAGANKADIINNVLNITSDSSNDYPVLAISQRSEWHLDKEAATLLPKTLTTKHYPSKSKGYDQNTGC